MAQNKFVTKMLTYIYLYLSITIQKREHRITIKDLNHITDTVLTL
jgi:hypothetical protein